MGHNPLTKFIKTPGHELDPAGTAIRSIRGVPTTPKTFADPGNAVFTQSADPVNYGNPGAFQPRISQGPFIDPKTNMRAGGSPGTPMATSIGSLGGKNQFPVPNPQISAQQPARQANVFIPRVTQGQGTM